MALSEKASVLILIIGLAGSIVVAAVLSCGGNEVICRQLEEAFPSASPDSDFFRLAAILAANMLIVIPFLVGFFMSKIYDAEWFFVT